MSDETIEIVVPPPAMPGLKVAIIGAGKMGGILLQAFLKNDLLAPDQIVATHSTDGKVDRSRPLCPYPQVARYKGTGSIDEAASFSCKLP